MQLFAVSQLTLYLKEVLETDPLLQDIWVQGEVSNYRNRPRGINIFPPRMRARSCAVSSFAAQARPIPVAPISFRRSLRHPRWRCAMAWRCWRVGG